MSARMHSLESSIAAVTQPHHPANIFAAIPVLLCSKVLIASPRAVLLTCSLATSSGMQTCHQQLLTLPVFEGR